MAIGYTLILVFQDKTSDIRAAKGFNSAAKNTDRALFSAKSVTIFTTVCVWYLVA